jgi:RsiW-degrading membrane proteinase PrsW (M82 family)
MGTSAHRPAPHRLPLAAPEAQPHPLLTRGALFCGALSLGLIAGDLGLRAFGLGFLVAVVPVPVYVVLALWLDRFEPEPAKTLWQTFAWGATVAVFVALLVNIAERRRDAVRSPGPDAAELLRQVVTAPVVEELAKCFALLVLYRELKDEFDGVVDGVVYAAMVGLGFAMIENVQYYGAAIAEGTESSVVTFFLRGMVSPFAHPLFTAMFGIGLGIVRERHGEGNRWGPPLLGLRLAIGLHALWNLAASFEGWFFAAVPAGDAPGLRGRPGAHLPLAPPRGPRPARAPGAAGGRRDPHADELECPLPGPHAAARQPPGVAPRRRGAVARPPRAAPRGQRAGVPPVARAARPVAGEERDAERDAEYLRRLGELCERGREG